MKKLLATFSLALASVGPVLADPGGACHFHGSRPAAESVVLKCADQRKASLVKEGRLDANWSPVAHESIAMVDGKKGKEWRVVYSNPAITDKAKTTLYMFFTPVGNFIAANHTGQ